jgi:hypothetical protein
MKAMHRLLPLLLGLVWAQSALGVSVTNGDFGTGDFTGWTLDTDGFPGTANDFQVVGSPGDYQAEIQADYWSTPGDIASTPLNDVFVANTLHQELDTALSPGAMMRLTFDWVFTGEDGDPVSGDVFTVALHDGMDNLYGADGTLGFLVHPRANYGSGFFSALLDTSTFANTTGWLLEFQLSVGVNVSGEPNGFGSIIQINNVELIEVTGAPTPSSVTLLALGLSLLLSGWGDRGKRRFR